MAQPHSEGARFRSARSEGAGQTGRSARAALLLLALALGGCATTAAPPPAAVSAPAPAAPVADPVANPGDAAAPDTMRWLYGSGEAAGASIQAYRMLADFAIARAAEKPALSVVMGLPDAEGGTGTGTVSCLTADGTRKPYAVVFDVDETILLNRGFEYWQATHGGKYDREVWDDWAKHGAPYVAPIPGAVTGMKRMREAGITMVFNTNRSSDTAAGATAAIDAAGLGPAVHGDTLFLSGDDAMGSRKDGRRATIAARYCVLALAGDNLGDFADVFNDRALSVQDRRQLAARGTFAQLWGNGWFALPNPVYGASIRGSVDEVFPPDARWMPGPAPIMDRQN
ncbi:MAG: acid phosphatase [Sphingomonadales bacterium]|nr:acid phosphatase [Sphingomonadales bacterium]MBD3772993.1 acid phosphatase [Paracoccaceae bacterium]